eukprot:scaffold149383_cov48-Attheya_sp.AAC.2
MISIKSILRLLLVITALLAVGADETVTSIRGRVNTIIAEAQNREDLQEQDHRMVRISEGGGIHDLIHGIMDIAQKATDFASRVANFCAENGSDGGVIQEFCDDVL